MKLTKDNPMIDEVPAETFNRAFNALQWLEIADRGVCDAAGGELSDKIQTGQYFLRRCAMAALQYAWHQRDVEDARPSREAEPLRAV